MAKKRKLTTEVLLEACKPREDGLFTMDRIAEWTDASFGMIEKALQREYYRGFVEYYSSLQDARLTEQGREFLQKLRGR